MKDPKALQLFQEVLIKTQEGRINWQPTASEGQYFNVLPSGRALVVSKTHVSNSWGDSLGDEFALVLKADEQELLRVADNVDGVGTTGLAELYELVRRAALHVDATVDQVLGDLARL